MSPKDLKAKFRWIEDETYCRWNLSALDGLCSPDIIVHLYPFPDIRGLDAVKSHVTGFHKAYSDVRIEWENELAEGDLMAFSFTMRMKHSGISHIFQLPPTGKELILKGSDIVHVKDGKFVEVFAYDNYLGLYQQLGIMKPF
jgi:predicted ester cyclase